MSSLQPIPHFQRQAALFERQSVLTRRLNAVEAALDAPQSPDSSEMAIAREDDEVLEATGLSAQQELRQIAAALTRLKDRTYGICAKCGGVIAEARLNALPCTPHCRLCAA